MVSGPLTPAEVAALAVGDEDSFTEFKSAETSSTALAKELCALLNTQGGRVLIGVEDDHAITGVGSWDGERVMNVARTLIQPPALPTWQQVRVDLKMIGIVAVDMGTDKPYAVGGSGGEGRRYYVRVGSTSDEASREELIGLTQASGAMQPDLRPVVDARADDLRRARAPCPSGRCTWRRASSSVRWRSWPATTR